MGETDVLAVVLSDTHREEGHGLTGRAKAAASTADHIVHAGDFTTGPVLESFRSVGPSVAAVHGNRDTPTVRDRVPATRTLSVAGYRLAICHGDDRERTGLTLFGRANDASIVVTGHTHRPHLIDGDDVVLFNPGSHTRPRGGEPTHGELVVVEAGLHISVRSRNGTVVTERVLGDEG